ncbi:MAG: ATPase AAA [Cenarchaeum symbiont of Oopsacas minuta]|nr:ATPase AAA [Cenarchaeum symbiont of Oopsacas minuta]
MPKSNKTVKYEANLFFSNRRQSTLHTFDLPKDLEKEYPLLHITQEYHNFNDLVINKDVVETLHNIISENKSIDRLNSYGLWPKNKILFSGPPGTGKTLSAKILSTVMGYPLAHVTFDAIISSYLGDTATNLRKIFEFIEKHQFVVLFDEFDMVGKKRDDPHEHGEIKRVVNNFMQMLDNFKGSSIIIAATNHVQLLDTAMWRRFDEILNFDLPDAKRRKILFKKYLSTLHRSDNLTPELLSKQTVNYSAADIAKICIDAMCKSIIDESNVITNEYITWAINQQKRRKKAISIG